MKKIYCSVFMFAFVLNATAASKPWTLMSSFNEQESAWVADKGLYKIHIGSSSANIKLNALFTLNNRLTVQKVKNVLAPKQTVTELH